MTLEERIEAAARDLVGFLHRDDEAMPQWAEMTPDQQAGARDLVRSVTDSLGLTSAPPTHWIAPMMPADEMWHGFRSVNCKIGEGGMEEFTYFKGDFGNWLACMIAARDAYLDRERK